MRKRLQCCEFAILYEELRAGLGEAGYSGRASLSPTSPTPVEKGRQWHENRSDLG